MEIILIACCSRKIPGGTYTYPGAPLEKSLGPTLFQRLAGLRKELASLLDEKPGPDLGRSTTELVEYLPAIERYDGIVYRSGRIRELISRSTDFQIVIISALYGLLSYNDPIRDYNHTMVDSIPGHGRLKTWWKKRDLGKIVENYILRLTPSRVHDLLTGDYREALQHWLRTGLAQNGILVTQYDFPGLGLGGLYRRGEIVEKLLSGK